jgi:hypothetical protein
VKYWASVAGAVLERRTSAPVQTAPVMIRLDLIQRSSWTQDVLVPMKLITTRCTNLVFGVFACVSGAFAAPITVTDSSNLYINFNGSGGDPVQLIDGLTAQLHLYNFSFTAGTGIHSGQTRITFDFDLSNTSSNPVSTSRISGIGFNITPDLVNTSDNSLSGVFDTIVIAPNFPNQIGTVEFCFTAQNCPGGGGAGVTKGSTSSGKSAVLYVATSTQQLRIDNGYVRYQDVACTGRTCPTSATGTITNGEVPEPSTYALFALGLVGFVIAKRKRAQ